MHPHEVIQKINSAMANDDLQAAEKALEEYIRAVAADYYEFKHEYHRIESMNVRHYNIEKYGSPTAITWVGAGNDKIWDSYKNGVQLKRYFEK